MNSGGERIVRIVRGASHAVKYIPRNHQRHTAHTHIHADTASQAKELSGDFTASPHELPFCTGESTFGNDTNQILLMLPMEILQIVGLRHIFFSSLVVVVVIVSLRRPCHREM